MLMKFAYPIAIKIDSILDSRVNEALKILNFGENATLLQLQEFRLQALLNLIEYSYSFVPYYRDLFNQIGLKPKDFTEIKDIQRIPVLTKNDIRHAGKRLQSTEIEKMDYLITRSGGTTGEPIASYVGRRARALATYAARRGQMWMGWKPGVRVVTLFGGSLGKSSKTTLRARLRDYALGTDFLPAFELTKENVEDYHKVIRKNSPCIIKGYASALYNLALFTEEINYIPSKILYVFSTAEYLPDKWAKKIAAVFNCPVKSYYGCGEINSLGFQVEQSGPYIVPDEHVIVESKSQHEDEKVDCDHSLLITSLFNYAQPLIRYQVGDIGQVSQPGLLHPTRTTITNLVGRTSDMFVKEDGTLVSPSLAPHLVSKINLSVRKYQFIQNKINEIEFLYDPLNGDISELEKRDIEEILKLIFSESMAIKFKKTSNFVLSPNQKMRLVISKIIK